MNNIFHKIKYLHFLFQCYWVVPYCTRENKFLNKDFLHLKPSVEFSDCTCDKNHKLLKQHVVFFFEFKKVTNSYNVLDTFLPHPFPKSFEPKYISKILSCVI